MSLSTRYEHKRENLWKDIKEDDDEGFIPIRSYFKQLGRGEQHVGGVAEPIPKPVVDFKRTYCPKKAIATLKRKMRQKTLWKPYEVNDWLGLLHYLEQCKAEGAKKCLLSWKEVFIIEGQPKKRK